MNLRYRRPCMVPSLVGGEDMTLGNTHRGFCQYYNGEETFEERGFGGVCSVGRECVFMGSQHGILTYVIMCVCAFCVCFLCVLVADYLLYAFFLCLSVLCPLALCASGLVNSVLSLVSALPSYTLLITGHSLGGAMAGNYSYYRYVQIKI